MSYVMTARQFANKAIDIAKNYKTLYVMGCFGAPMTPENKKRYTTNHAYNKRAERTAMINAATSDTFGFDCVCLIKGILWGWCGDVNAIYGGAKYASNGVPDYSANGMISICSGVTKDFSKIEVGEAVWLEGHIGIYIGDGLAVECTPKWENRVQITAVGNMGSKSGYNTRTWTKHGKLPYVDYTAVEEQPPADSEINFVDVPTTAWYYDAVKWAVENGITTGTDSTHFTPSGTVTRAELVTMLYRMYQKMAGDNDV